MKNDSPTEDVIRQYLLGRLDGQDKREGQVSKQLFSNDELSEIADSIEDEIIEDYLDDKVSAGDRRAIEEYFLCPDERKKKLQFALVLRNHFEVPSTLLTKKKLNIPSQPASVSVDKSGFQALTRHWHSYSRLYYEMAAAALIIVSGIFYVSIVSHRLQSQLDAACKSQAQASEELVREREHSTSLEQRLQAIPPTILLFPMGHYRQGGAPIVEIKPWTQRIRVEIELPSASSGVYAVHLETKTHETIWSQAGVSASSGKLRFDIPAAQISPGDYCIVVSSQPERDCFQAKLAE